MSDLKGKLTSLAKTLKSRVSVRYDISCIDMAAKLEVLQQRCEGSLKHLEKICEQDPDLTVSTAFVDWDRIEEVMHCLASASVAVREANRRAFEYS